MGDADSGIAMDRIRQLMKFPAGGPRETPRVFLQEDAITVSLLCIEEFHRNGDPDYFHTLRFVLSNPIPRDLWPDKPQALGESLPESLGEFSDGYVNWGTGIIGNAFHDGGLWMAGIYGLLVGGVFRIFDDILRRQPLNPWPIAMLAAMSPKIVAYSRGGHRHLHGRTRRPRRHHRDPDEIDQTDLRHRVRRGNSTSTMVMQASMAWTPAPSEVTRDQRRGDDVGFFRLALDSFVFSTPFRVAGLISRSPLDRSTAFSTVVGEAFGAISFEGAIGREVFGLVESAEDGSTDPDPVADPVSIPICSSIPSTNRSNGMPAARMPSVSKNDRVTIQQRRPGPLNEFFEYRGVRALARIVPDPTNHLSLHLRIRQRPGRRILMNFGIRPPPPLVHGEDWKLGPIRVRLLRSRLDVDRNPDRLEVLVEMECRTIVGELDGGVRTDRCASHEERFHTGQHRPENSGGAAGVKGRLQPIVIRIRRADVRDEFDGLSKRAASHRSPGLGEVFGENVQSGIAGIQILIELHDLAGDRSEGIVKPEAPNTPVIDVLRSVVDEGRPAALIDLVHRHLSSTLVLGRACDEPTLDDPLPSRPNDLLFRGLSDRTGSAQKARHRTPQDEPALTS